VNRPEPGHTQIAVTVVILAAALLFVALPGLLYGLVTNTLPVQGWVSVLFNANFIAASTDDPPGTLDPGYDKDVADCSAVVVSDELVEVAIANAYPSYTCTFTTTVRNSGILPEQLESIEIIAPPELTVTDLNDLTGLVLDPGEEEVEEFSVHVEQEAEQGAVYVITIYKNFRQYAFGTPGFWMNWDRHNTFSEGQIETWLTEIDASSAWHGPTTVEGMEDVFAAARGKRANGESGFLAQYLATRLNERSGILDAADVHDVTGEDPGNYLGLSDPTSATLTEIIAGIEAKYGTSPTKAGFNRMKDVCDALNNLDI
jgi:hypothetical protein